MRIGVVVGSVWATKKSPLLTGQSLLRVRVGAQELVAAVEHRNGTWTVLQWQAVSTDREENESAPAVWPGPQ